LRKNIQAVSGPDVYGKSTGDRVLEWSAVKRGRANGLGRSESAAPGPEADAQRAALTTISGAAVYLHIVLRPG